MLKKLLKKHHQIINSSFQKMYPCQNNIIFQNLQIIPNFQFENQENFSKIEEINFIAKKKKKAKKKRMKRRFGRAIPINNYPNKKGQLPNRKKDENKNYPNIFT